MIHRADRGSIIKYVTSAGLNNFVHQINKIGSLVGSLILLSEMFDSIVYKVLESQLGLGRPFINIVEELEELSCILLAISVTIWLIEQL
jgi:hypothetical protein